MPWIVVFIYSWLIFLLFVDRRRIRQTVWGGLAAAVTGTLVDWAGHQLHFYHFFFFNGVTDEFIVTMLHATGPMFTMGTLFFQFLSPDRRLQAVNVAAFSLSYLAVEVLIVASGGARYDNWHYLASLAVNITVFFALSYLGEVIVFRKFRI